jgi:hypothetical protein
MFLQGEGIMQEQHLVHRELRTQELNYLWVKSVIKNTDKLLLYRELRKILVLQRTGTESAPLLVPTRFSGCLGCLSSLLQYLRSSQAALTSTLSTLQKKVNGFLTYRQKRHKGLQKAS